MRLANPWWLLLLLLVPLLWSVGRRHNRRAAVRYPSLAVLRAISPAGAGRRRLVLGLLRSAVVILIALAMARPQAGSAAAKVHREGVD
ncbi:MAG: BatA domain-containing protein, partial [Candidatus Binatia bacterium]